jgi:CxxC motif-containing protein
MVCYTGDVVVYEWFATGADWFASGLLHWRRCGATSGLLHWRRHGLRVACYRGGLFCEWFRKWFYEWFATLATLWFYVWFATLETLWSTSGLLQGRIGLRVVSRVVLRVVCYTGDVVVLRMVCYTGDVVVYEWFATGADLFASGFASGFTSGLLQWRRCGFTSGLLHWRRCGLRVVCYRGGLVCEWFRKWFYEWFATLVTLWCDEWFDTLETVWFTSGWLQGRIGLRVVSRVVLRVVCYTGDVVVLRMVCYTGDVVVYEWFATGADWFSSGFAGGFTSGLLH